MSGIRPRARQSRRSLPPAILNSTPRMDWGKAHPGDAPAVVVLSRDRLAARQGGDSRGVMAAARIGGDCAMPKGLRRGFAVAAFQASLPPHLVQRWLGHASLRTTAIYAEVSGAEEFGFAERMWD